MVEGYKIWKTTHNHRDYWFLSVNKTTAAVPELKRFNTKAEAVRYFLDHYIHGKR